jgi:hypothetical protein
MGMDGDRKFVAAVITTDKWKKTDWLIESRSDRACEKTEISRFGLTG